jgi:hypothetical protein
LQTPSSYLTETKPTQNKVELESQSEPPKVETLHEVPQSVPEALSTAILTPDDKDKAVESSGSARSCSLIDLETFQKMRFNNLSNRSAHWDPKVFRKIAQLIDPPKSPTETPPESSNSSRPNSPDTKNLASKFRGIFFGVHLDQFYNFLDIPGDMAELTHIFDHLSTEQNRLHGNFVSFFIQ